MIKELFYGAIAIFLLGFLFWRGGVAIKTRKFHYLDNRFFKNDDEWVEGKMAVVYGCILIICGIAIIYHLFNPH